MSSEIIAQLGPVGLVIILLAKEILAFLKTKKTPSPSAGMSAAINSNTQVSMKISEQVESMQRDIENLNKMHEVKDNTGRPVWYCKHDQ